MKNTVGRWVKWNFFFSIFRVDIFERKTIIFSENKEEKPLILSAQSIYSFGNKIEEHSRRIIGNSN